MNLFLKTLGKFKDNKNLLYNDVQKVNKLAIQIQRKLHVSTPDGEPSKFELLKKIEISQNFPVDNIFLNFLPFIQRYLLCTRIKRFKVSLSSLWKFCCIS